MFKIKIGLKLPIIKNKIARSMVNLIYFPYFDTILKLHVASLTRGGTCIFTKQGVEFKVVNISIIYVLHVF